MSERDLISDTFTTLRATAKRRNGTVPNLGKQGTTSVSRRTHAKKLADVPANTDQREAITVPGIDLEPETKSTRTRNGRPSGPDGRAPQRSYNVAGFASLVKKEIADREWSENIAHGWVMGNWETLVGEKIAQHTEVSMIKDGELFISCDQTAWATNLKYMQSTVLSQIAEKIGPDVITKLHVYPPKTKNWRYGPLHVKGRGPRDTYG